MPVWQAVVYGVVQGLAEFLPISSSAHLTLLPWAFGWEDPGLAFDVALHWGTLAAVLAIFWKDWIRLFNAGLTGRGSRSEEHTSELQSRLHLVCRLLLEKKKNGPH